MPVRLGNISFDCSDVLRVARFWSSVLGRPLDDPSGPQYASIGFGDPDRAEPAWFFEKVPELKVAKNRMHLDLIDPDPAAVERLTALGASTVEQHQLGAGGHQWTVMQDPEGNEFCISDESYSG